jgi:hypothetical protein
LLNEPVVLAPHMLAHLRGAGINAEPRIASV